MFQFVPIASCPGAVHHQKQRGSIIFTPCLQAFIGITDFPWIFLWSRPSSTSSQPLLTAEVLQFFHHLHGPSLDTVQISYVLAIPEVDTVLHMLTSTEGKDNFPQPSRNTPLSATRRLLAFSVAYVYLWVMFNFLV